jgi:hypothetical protein
MAEIVRREARDLGRLAGRGHRLLGAVDRKAREDPPLGLMRNATYHVERWETAANRREL